MKAEDVLSNAELAFSLPSCALALPGLQAILGITQRAAEQAMTRPERGTGCSQVILDTVGWEWETDLAESYDEDGNMETREFRTELCLDTSATQRLAQRRHAVCSALRVLGIPYDCSLSDGQGPEASLHSARLNASDPAGYCDEATPLDKPGFAEIAKIAACASDLAEFRDWLADYQPDPRTLAGDASRFAELFSMEGRPAFLEASARILALGAGPYHSFWRGDARWDPKASEWIRTRWGGQDPMRRFCLGGMPIPMPQLARFVKMGMEQPEPDLEFIRASLDAYCSCSAKMGRQYGEGLVAPDAAVAIGSCLEAHPELAALLSPEAKAVFDLNLRAPTAADGRNPLSPGGFALAEAHWLRGQSMAARGAPAASPKARSL